MLVKRIFNRFPVIQHVSSNVRHFSTFLPFLAFPGYAPGTIAVNVIRLERGFNACKTPRCIYPSIFNRFWDSKLLVENCHIFIPHLCLAAPQGVTPSEFREDLETHKTRMNGLSCGEESMAICSAVLIKYKKYVLWNVGICPIAWSRPLLGSFIIHCILLPAIDLTEKTRTKSLAPDV